MPLTTGSRLGPYEVLSVLGSGGMGEVYKARDSRLDRSVALKVIAADKVADAERKRRFVQEAKAASALNHPSIVTIYDIGSESGVDYLAMELVSGKTLDQLTPRDGMPIKDVLKIGIQAADALAKAHGAGIVHRDLKPGNVMVSSDGLVKILDFGLAKLLSPSEPLTGADAGQTTEQQTLAPKTDEGRIVGTVSYMSPEQAEGRAVDARSDIFSFGAVLYEMLTGRRAFLGDSAVSTLSAILRDEPRSVTDLRPAVPSELVRVIKRCMRKDPARRFQTMADLKVTLEELKEESDSGTLLSAQVATAVAAPRTSRFRAVAIAAGLVAAAVAGAGISWLATRKPVDVPVEALRAVPITSYQGSEQGPTFSPDGSQVAFSWDGERRDNYDIYLKIVGSGAPLRLTADPHVDFGPKWSPDGRTIAFMRQSDAPLGLVSVIPPATQTSGAHSVILIPALGGSERVLARFRATGGGTALAWSPDGKWLVVSGGDNRPVRLNLVSVETGDAKPLTDPSRMADGDFDPSFSPDGRSIAFMRLAGMQVSEIHILSLSATLEVTGDRMLPTEGPNPRRPAWTADGREILYSAGLDLQSHIYRVAADGTGIARGIDSLGDAADGPVLSPRGAQLMFERFSRNSTIWRLDTKALSAPPQELIASTSREASPQYSPDGTRIVFYSNRTGSNQIWMCDADGSRPVQLTTLSGTITGTPRWAPDGQHISFDSNTGGQWQIYVMDAGGGKPTQVTTDEFTNVVSSWSSDGQWIYYTSRKSGDENIWKVPAHGGTAVQLTHEGGTGAMETPDGRTIYFVKSRGYLSGLWRMPAAGGPEAQVAPSVFRYNFAVTDQGVYYDTPTTSTPSTINYVDAASGKNTVLFTLPKTVDLGLAVSRDRRFLLFAESEASGSDLMFVDNFK